MESRTAPNGGLHRWVGMPSTEMGITGDDQIWPRQGRVMAASTGPLSAISCMVLETSSTRCSPTFCSSDSNMVAQMP